MKLQKVNCIFWLAVALLAAAACKKDDDDKVSPSLNGSLSFKVPEYVTPGYVAKMTPTGISHPDGKGIGYYWKVTPGMTSADTTRYENGLNSDGYETDGTFTYWFPDSLGTYTVSCYGFAKDYSSSYSSKYVTVVKGGLDGSITGTGILPKDKFIEADGVRYYYAMVNGIYWFRNNLANPAYAAPSRRESARTPRAASQRRTTTRPGARRARTAGAYIASTATPGSANSPAVTARTRYLNLTSLPFSIQNLFENTSMRSSRAS